MGYLPWLISRGLLRLNPMREHLITKLSLAAASVLVACGGPVSLVVDVLSPSVLCMIALMAILLMIISHGEYGFTCGELMLF